MWEEVTHYAKLFGGWLGVRVINALSVAAAFATNWLNSPAMAPLVALPTGLAFATYVSYSENHMEKRRITNAFRPEIAALTGKHWKQVTTDDLDTLAVGHRGNDQPAIKAFEEKINQNNSKRFLSLLGHVVGAAVAFGAIWFGFSHFEASFIEAGNSTKEFVSSLGLGSWGANIPAMTAAGVISLISDTAFTVIGERVLGLNKDTVYDMVQTLKKEMRNGRMVTEEKVFGIVLAANPGFAESIQEKYGQTFDKLPAKYQKEIINAFNQSYPIKQITEEIDSGARRANELAFFAYGQQSGVPLKEPVRETAETRVKELAAAREKTHHKEVAISVSETVTLPSTETPGSAVSSAQYEGFLSRAATQAIKGSFVERLEQGITNSPSIVKA